MRNVTRDTLTDAVIASFAGAKSDRLKYLVACLVAHLHAFARETKLTPAEWKAAIDFLYAAGKISDERRNEFILLSDVLGVSSLIDLINSPEGATESSELGPFHSAGSPLMPVGADLIKGNAGDRVLVRGRVMDTAGRPIPGALLDFWQAAKNGLYPAQDGSQHPENLRCRMRTDGEGRYAFTTIKPAPYAVPCDGPVGNLLRAGGREAWRLAHFHFIVTADGHVPIVTELFSADDPYVERDAVFGVRESLIIRYVRQESAAAAAPYKIASPFYSVDFDFRLSRNETAD
ncbi:MAG TPA: dioxygenase, partial [Burkholderiales bacterium]|nr:dioxygenase [Burkholderiales bacterium]